MKGIIILCFVSYACAAVIDECAQGQAHWCTSLKVAKKCGAVQHCIDNVWSQQAPYKSDVGDVCSFCKHIIGDVRNLFNNNSEAKIEKYMDASCALIPVPELADACKDYVNKDIPEIYKMIRANLDPGAVCSAMCLCSSYKDFTVQPVPLHRVALVKANQDIGVRVASLLNDEQTTTSNTTTTTPKPDLCKDCLKLVTDVKTLITDQTTEAQVEAFLKQQVCNNLGPISSECTTLVDTYIPELMQLLQEQVDPNLICSLLGFCNGGDRSLLPRMRLSKSPLFKAASQLQGTKECDACKVLLSELQDLDRNQVLQNDLETVLKEKLCPILGTFKQDCITTIDSYGQFLFEFLANELDPATRCESLGFCSSANALPHQISATRQATQALPVKKLTVGSVTQSPQCVLCEFIIDKLDSILEKNSTESEIISAFDKVCKILPATIKEECDSFVQTYGPAVLDLLLQEVTPQIICTTLGLCMGKTVSVKPAVIVQERPVLKTSETCGICEMIINYLNSALEENATEAEVEKLLNKVCDVLPGTIKKECEGFVETYGPMIIKLVVQFDDPKKVCQELGLCPKMKTTKMRELTKADLIKPQLTPLVGENKCTYGPAYWCSSQATAEECKATAHCKKHVWK